MYTMNTMVNFLINVDFFCKKRNRWKNRPACDIGIDYSIELFRAGTRIYSVLCKSK